MLRKNLVIGFLFIYIISKAQDYIYKNFTTSDGLNSSEVYDITQDKNGFLWFATDRGLTRYDGYEFKKYTTKDGLTDTVIFNFYEQKDGRILCSTYNKKLFFYNPNHDEFIPYSFNYLLADIPKEYTFNTIKIDDECSVFINFKGISGYILINDKGEIENALSTIKIPIQIKFEEQDPYYTYIFNESTKRLNRAGFIEEFPKMDWYYGAIYKPTQDRIVTTVNKRVHIINTKEKVEQFINDKQDILISGEFDENHFWVGLQGGGAKIYDYDGKLIDHLLSNKSVTKIIKDHEGGLWLATINSGVFYVKNPDLKRYLTAVENQNIHSLTSNDKQELYIGSYTGELYKKKDKKFNLFWKSPYTIGNNKTKVQYYNRDSTLVIQSLPFLMKIEDDKVINTKEHMNIHALSDNIHESALLAGKYIYEYQQDSVILKVKSNFKKKILDIAHADKGYYLATLSGLFHFKEDSLYDLGKNNPLLSYRIDDIDKKEGRYYMATMGGGVIVKDRDTIFTIDTKNGLSSNSATQVYVPTKEEVYVATNEGFNRILFKDDFKNYTIARFSYKNGLPSNEVNDIELVKDTIWIATKKGLYSMPEKSMNPTDHVYYKDWLQVNKIEVNNIQTENFDELQHLPYNQNTITIHFSSISFKNTNNILYRYRLLGKENDWNVTKNKEVRYLGLTPGNYIFELQTKGGNKNWNTQSHYIQINIHNPFWNTSWFYGLVFIIIILIIYSFFRFNVLQYNKDIIREFLRITLKKVKGEKNYITIKESGIEIKLDTSTILFVKSAGNYLEIYTKEKMYLVREKIGDFEKKMPNPLEYMRIHRSYLVRIDQIDQKNHKYVMILDQKIPVSAKYKENMDKIIL